MKKILFIMIAAAITFVGCKKDDPKSAACEIVSFTVNGTAWDINGTDITHAYPPEMAETSLTPTVSLSPGATVNPASGAAQNFFTEQGITYTVTAQDGTTTKTYTAKATIEVEMIYVRGGTYTMGSTENSSHQVTLSDFYIGKYEVTQAQWKAVMDDNPSHFKDDNLPVENVSWNDVQEFILELNRKTGKQYRLPTEAEWEYAARGGSQSRGYIYSGSNNVNEVAWLSENSDSKTHPVGTKQANELEIYDMSGNVFEWCQDWYATYSSDSQTNPEGPFSGSDRVNRGGSWGGNAGSCRVADRYNNSPGLRSDALGFRLACSSK
jgi:formylglycine-generating enzyme required for sulfatase activity